MTNEPVAGLILAGGLARRMGGGDKPLIEVGGRTLLSRTVERLSGQARPVILNANGAPERFGQYGLPVVADVLEGYGGPLVGVLTGLEWVAAHAPHVRWMVSVAADTPLFPEDLAARLLEAAAAEGAEMAVAASDGRSHPVFGLWPVSLAPALRHAVADRNVRKIDAFTAAYRIATVDWPTAPYDPFFNVNTPDDIKSLKAILAG